MTTRSRRRNPALTSYDWNTVMGIVVLGSAIFGVILGFSLGMVVVS